MLGGGPHDPQAVREDRELDGKHRIEARARSPLMPLRLFRQRNLATANVLGVLWAAAMFAWFFLSALYLQLVLGYMIGRVVIVRCPVEGVAPEATPPVWMTLELLPVSEAVWTIDGEPADWRTAG